MGFWTLLILLELEWYHWLMYQTLKNDNSQINRGSTIKINHFFITLTNVNSEVQRSDIVPVSSPTPSPGCREYIPCFSHMCDSNKELWCLWLLVHNKKIRYHPLHILPVVWHRLQYSSYSSFLMHTIVSQLSTLLGGAEPPGQLNPWSSVLLKDRTAHRGSRVVYGKDWWMNT